MAIRVKRQTEAEFTQTVIDVAHLFGWLCAHFRPGMNRRGQWSTAVQGDGVGFLDLVLVRERVVWAELKSEKGSLSGAQNMWIQALLKAGQEVHVWRPSEWTTIQEVLR